jgi:hypothetical protein
MRFQRNLPGFTVMGKGCSSHSRLLEPCLLAIIFSDPDKFDRAIETITGRQVSSRSTPRRTSAMHQPAHQRFKTNTTFRRSISMDDLGTRQAMEHDHRIEQRYAANTILTRTNSVTQVPQAVSASRRAGLRIGSLV